jgi:hypothetical protein
MTVQQIKSRMLFIGGHDLSTFEGCFNKYGSIELKVNPDALLEQAKQLQKVAQKLSDLLKKFQDYETWEEAQVNELRRKYSSKTGAGGTYQLLDNGDVKDVLRKLAPYRKHGNNYFHDPDSFGDYINYLKKRIDALNGYSQKTKLAAQTMQSRDVQVAKGMQALR